MITLQEKEIVKNKIKSLVKESLYEFFSEKDTHNDKKEKEDKKKDKYDSKDEYEKSYGRDEELSRKERNIISALDDANEDEITSFNLTRSQIAYALWPDLDKDAARSKLSQKINGEKSFKPWEINDVYKMINNVTA